jgi:aspartate/methionine/tyrosine aminotransferase
MKIASRARNVIAPPIVAFKDTLRDLLAQDDVVDLSQAVPAYPPPPVVAGAMTEAARDPLAARYTPDPGLPECRAAVASYLARRHDGRLTGDHVLVTPGANAAFHFVANVLVEEGERVFLFSPYYFNHAMSIELLGGSVEEVRLPASGPLGELIAAGLLEGVTPGSVLVAVNPSNPTGRCLDRHDIAALLEWARERAVRLVLDETYLEHFPAALDPVTGLSFDRWWEVAVVIGSFSKSLAVTGYRVGYLCAAPSVIHEVLKVQDTAVVCAPRPGQMAVTAALAWPGLDEWLAERRLEIDERVTAFTRAIADRPGPFTVENSGAFFAYVAHDAGLAATMRVDTQGEPVPPRWRVADRLAREASVVCLPGAPFGASEQHHLRVAVGNETPERLREAALRMQTIDAHDTTIEG